MMLNRVSLNTIGLNRIGLNRIGKSSRGSSDRPYIDPEVLASLKAVCICYGKSNDDPDRAIIKNLVDPDNPFVISNAAYTEGSGYADKGSPYYGAFVTDGIDDQITSTKTVQEMGITDEVTVVSMIHQITLNSAYNFSLTNYIENLDGSGRTRNEVFAVDKTGIYGYSASLVNKTTSIINTILGDKNDYIAGASSTSVISDAAKFSVVGRASNISEVSSIAWYWTIIANRVLTTDQINQVIAYFNLDRTLKPDIYCDIAKQGITNDNHADFNDKLVDYSGNGRDIQMYNLAWNGNSGIGKYSQNFFAWATVSYILERDYHKVYNTEEINEKSVELLSGSSDITIPFKIRISNLLTGAIEYKYFPYESTGYVEEKIIFDSDGEYTMPAARNDSARLIFTVGTNANVVIEEIPSHAGALCLDGVNDFGKVTGMPIYKDYTAIVCREFISDKTAPILSKAKEPNNGAFVMEIIANPNLGNTALYSFGKDTPNIDIIQSKSISYQTKYIYNSKDIVPGNGVDSDTMWIGKLRDNHAWFANAAIYSLMSFPYSMSEFLIERQLKKYKLGTLYPDMVEFRPVINGKTDLIKEIKWFSNSWSKRIYPGDYITKGVDVTATILLNYNGLKLTKASYGNEYTEVRKQANWSETNNIWDLIIHNIGKSPQKIDITIEQDENYVLFNPTINSNAIFEVGNEQNMTELIAKVRNHEIDGFIMYLSKLESKYILPNSWINKDTEVISSIYCLDNILQDDLHINIDGNSKYCLYADSSNNISEFLIMDDNVFEEQYITNVLTANTIDIQLDQYIRFEDIVQPYPLFFEFTDENGNLISWGGKAKVGSTITRTKPVTNANLLAGMYNTSSYKLNGKPLEGNSYIVEKSMVFTCTATWAFDNNEPNCILSPRLLRIPNSSYKILGHIPDISGHGNHGVIHNSAYAEGSGVNEDGSYQFDSVDDFVTIPTLSSGGKQVFMKVNWSKNTFNEILYDQRENLDIHTFAIFNHDSDTVTGESVVAYNSKNNGNTYIDGILNYNIKASELKDIEHNITITNESVNTNNSISPTIGTNKNKDAHYAKMALYDFMSFPDISTDDKIKELNEYVGIEAKVELPPYYFDTHGKTNLDEDRDYIANLGTVQDVIEVSQPAIFAENWYDYYESFVSRSPIINKTDYSIEVKPTHMDNNFNMLLSVNCDTPLPAFRAKFTRTSNVDVSYAEIRYEYYVNGERTYIDIFGENNSAESVILDIPASEKSSISGSNADNFPNILIEVLPADNSVRYGLSNKNLAYDKMSGYGGYEFAKFDNIAEWISTNNSDTIEAVNREGYTVTLKKVGNGTNYWHFRNTIIKSLGQDIQIGVYANKSVQIVWQLKYKLEGETDYNTLAIASPTIEGNINTYVTLPYKTEQEIADLNAVDTYYSIYFIPIDLNIDEEVTIEMLPLYDGLVYDGVTDYSENVNIPAFTDYTYILKRQILKGIANSAVMYKGNITVNQGGAFICNYCEPSNTNLFTDFSFGGLLRSNDINKPIIYGTKTSVNGNSITPGEKIDTVGINVGKWINYLPMVFYKLILYPKTIPLLQINFLKNLMEKDEIIDLNNKIFIQE